MPKRWLPSHQELLKGLRVGAGHDLAAFAKRHALSVVQLRELEEGGQGAFYSEDIKAFNGLKLLLALGHVPPPPPPPAPPPAAQADSTADREPVRAGPVAAADAAPDARRSRVLPVAGAVLLAIAVAVTIALLTGRFTLRPTPAATQAAAPASAPEPAPATAAPAEPRPEPAPETAPGPLVSPAVTTLPVPAPPVMPATSATVTAAPDSACPDGEREPRVTYVSPVALKPATYVYVESSRAATVCVIDSQNQVTRRALQAGETINIPGVPPFTLHSPQWSELRVFFQGRRVMLEGEVAPLTVILIPKAGG